VLSIRIAPMENVLARDTADAICDKVTSHPLVHLLEGTVILGTGSARLLLASDSQPRVMVPLALLQGPGALGRSQVASAAAVVVSGLHEVAELGQAITREQVVVVVPPAPLGEPVFLLGATNAETTDAWLVTHAHAELAAAMTATHSSASPPAADFGPTAEAIVEAVLATTCEAAGRGPRI